MAIFVLAHAANGVCNVNHVYHVHQRVLQLQKSTVVTIKKQHFSLKVLFFSKYKSLCHALTVPFPPCLFLLWQWVDLCVCGCPEDPLLYPPCRACHTGWCIRLQPPLLSPWPSFMMETDTNTVIGFRDKLFTLPMLSAAVSVLRGRPFYKWPLFLDLILLIDPWQRQYMCDWESAEDCTVKSSAWRFGRAGVCCRVLAGPVLRGIRCLKIYCLVNEMAVHRLQGQHINRALA